MKLPDYFRRLPRSSCILLLILLAVVVALVILIPQMKSERPSPKPVARKPVPERPQPEVAAKGLIAIIIDDFGYNNDAVARGFFKLDVPLTYAIIPGHTYSEWCAREAQLAGFETIIHMPMESQADLPGEEDYILRTDMTSTELEQRVNKAMQEFPFTRGMNNHQGSKATQDSRLMAIVATSLKRAGKYFIDSRTTAQSVAEQKCQSLGVPVARRNVFLDNDLDPALIKDQVQKLANYAERHGRAVGIGHGKLSTLEVLATEIPRLQAEGFRFVYASELVK